LGLRQRRKGSARRGFSCDEPLKAGTKYAAVSFGSSL